MVLTSERVISSHGFDHDNGLAHAGRSFLEKRDNLVRGKYHEDRRLAPHELAELISDWQPPERTLAIGNAEISVYRMTTRPEYRDIKKSPFRTWADERVLAEARKSYGMYGEVPLIDDYDMFKAHNYAVGFAVEENGQVRQKITFLRYVPYEGIPFSNEDFDNYVVSQPDGKKTSLIQAVRRATGDVWADKRIVTQSRLCTLDTMPVLDQTKRQDNKHLPLGFALASLQFFEDTGIEGAVISGQLHTKLSDEKLNYQGMVLPFAYAHEFLGTDKNAVNINQDKQETYKHRLRYAGYCLDVPALVAGIESLVENGSIKNESELDQFFPIDKPWHKVKERKSMSDWSLFGKMLVDVENANGNRQLIDKLLAKVKEVPDGPRLRLMHQDAFLAGCEEMVQYAMNSEGGECHL